MACASGASDFAKASSEPRRQPSFVSAPSVGELRLDLAAAVARRGTCHGVGGKPEGRRREPGALVAPTTGSSRGGVRLRLWGKARDFGETKPKPWRRLEAPRH